MARNEQIRAQLPDGSIVFDNNAYDNSIIGVSTDGRVIYGFYKMVEEIMNDENWSEQEATDWVEYNTIRALPYLGEKAPIVCEELMI